jgi:hypothetical protein
MPTPFPWLCPFCDCHATITDQHVSADGHEFNLNSKYGNQMLRTTAISCPNPECREIVVLGSLHDHKFDSAARVWKDGPATRRWNLVPEASSKVFPDYVPTAIRGDYREACLVRSLSPKASATLSRRCVQGIIRDFWGIRKARLKDEIDAIQDKVDPSTWDAIDAVRKLGNIGAHMEADINTIVDVDPEEAELMIELVETLIADWYVARNQRKTRMSSLTNAAKAKYG